MHVKFHSDMIIITSNLAVSRLYRDLAVERTTYRLVIIVVSHHNPIPNCTTLPTTPGLQMGEHRPDFELM